MFQLPFDILKEKNTISLHDPIYLIGSCFSDEIGHKLVDYKFPVSANLFGTVYNPLSISRLLEGTIDPKHLLEHQGVHFHWDCHSQLSDLSWEALTQKIKDQVARSASQLKSAQWLIVTLGSAWVYELESGHVVANCHRMPSRLFQKRMLSIQEIEESLKTTLRKLEEANPTLKIILTVSPVRHIKDGLVENNRSKARLLEATHRLSDEHENVSYFPAYEIVLDELRDYRFYKTDLVHPSPQAVDYVWEKFATTYFDSETQAFIAQWKNLLQALDHRPFHPSSVGHQQFLKNTLKKLETLNQTVDVRVEMDTIRKQIR